MYSPAIWDDQEKQRLLLAIAMIGNKEQAKAILGDILTQSEIAEISKRLAIAYYLEQGKSYEEIRTITGASTTTIASVSKAVKQGSGGYRLLLANIEQNLNDHFTASAKE